MRCTGASVRMMQFEVPVGRAKQPNAVDGRKPFAAPPCISVRGGLALHDSFRFSVQEIQAKRCLLFLVPARGRRKAET